MCIVSFFFTVYYYYLWKEILLIENISLFYIKKIEVYILLYLNLLLKKKWMKIKVNLVSFIYFFFEITISIKFGRKKDI